VATHGGRERLGLCIAAENETRTATRFTVGSRSQRVLYTFSSGSFRETPVGKAAAREMAVSITDLFRAANPVLRNWIETGFLQHVLVVPDSIQYLAQWKNDPNFADSYRAALAWGRAHAIEPSDQAFSGWTSRAGEAAWLSLSKSFGAPSAPGKPVDSH
jgi:hypothetical protein